MQSCMETNCWSVCQQSSCGKDGHENMKLSVAVDCDPVVPKTAQWLWKDSSECLNKTFSSAFRNLKHVDWFGVLSLELRLWHTLHLLDCCYCSFPIRHISLRLYVMACAQTTTFTQRHSWLTAVCMIWPCKVTVTKKRRLISIFWHCVLTCTYYSCIGITIYSVW